MEFYNYGHTFRSFNLPGSISENYDVRQPVIIHGDNFNINNNVTVKFNDILAYRVDVKTDVQDKKYLQVLLPGQQTFGTGIYNVTVQNSAACGQTLYALRCSCFLQWRYLS